jgi:hypothetical protein
MICQIHEHFLAAFRMEFHDFFQDPVVKIHHGRQMAIVYNSAGSAGCLTPDCAGTGRHVVRLQKDVGPMNSIQATLLTMGLALSTCRADDFARYAQILERRPFSSPAAEDGAAPALTVATPPAFVQNLRMVAITESPAGVRVGFVNIREQPPKPYYLYVGDSEDGMLLAEADYDKERALLRKDGEQFWMTMGAGTSGATNAIAPKPAPIAVALAEPPGKAQSGSTTVTNSNSAYAERRRQRLEEMRLRAQESRNLSEEEVEKQLREYQMKLIREGKTPLPIPITEEMDAQLVKEGILPAQE